MKRQVALNIVTVISLGLIACGGTAADPTLSFDASQLELDNGGIEMTDELPQFGEPTLTGSDFDWAPVDEASDTEDDAAEAAGRRVYYVQIVWGQLRHRPDTGLPSGQDAAPTSAPVVWDGAISAGAGAALRVLRVVRFEGGQGVVAAGGPQAVTFQSTTRPHNDGLIVGFTRPHVDGLILRVVAAGDLAVDAPVLTFTTPVVSATLTLGELAGLHRLVDTGNANGDRVAFMSLRRERTCTAGFIAGRWKRVEGRGGILGGMWMSHTGRARGHLRGIWGTRTSGERVLFGKIIDSEGRFIGRLRGTWEGSYFVATYTDRTGSPQGAVYGRFRGDDDRGFFRGRWARACGEGAVCRCEAPPAGDAPRDAVSPCSCETAPAAAGASPASGASAE